MLALDIGGEEAGAAEKEVLADRTALYKVSEEC